MPSFLAGQHDLPGGEVSRGRQEDRRPQDRPTGDSAPVEGIAEPGKEALLTRRELAGRRFLAAELS
jgi:hypothetical protein